MKAVHFGAGNIGRGFIGPLLINSGYELTFIDVDMDRIALINLLDSYPVIIVGNEERTEQVKGFKGIGACEIEKVVDAIAEAEVITTAVGKSALEKVAPLIAQGLSKKLESSKTGGKNFQIVVVACENVSDNTAHLLSLIRLYLKDEKWIEINALGSFPNCVVDRIVPNVTIEQLCNPLTVVVEEYSQFVLDQFALKKSKIQIQGAVLTDNISGILAQKLFTLNMAHSIVGYYGYLAGFDLVHEAVQDNRVHSLLEGALSEVSRLLVVKYGITEKEQTNYVHKMIHRFENPKLSDRVVRITKDPKRKLGPADRLIAPSKQALEAGILPAFLSTGIAGALAFDYQEDRQALELTLELRQRGVEAVLKDVSGLEPSDELARMIKSDFLFQQLVRH